MRVGRAKSVRSLMSLEKITFRLSFLATISSVIVLFLYIGYCDYQYKVYYDLVLETQRDLSELQVKCSENSWQTSCELISMYVDMIEGQGRKRDSYSRRKEISLYVLLFLPVCILFLFYGLRWSVTGKLKPIWPGLGNDN